MEIFFQQINKKNSQYGYSHKDTALVAIRSHHMHSVHRCELLLDIYTEHRLSVCWSHGKQLN